MSQQHEVSKAYWNYFSAIVEDLEHVSRYIEFSKTNFKTYSIELARLLLASSSEVDVIAKELCKLIDPQSKADNIKKYKSIILNKFPEITDQKVYINRYYLNYSPWNDWKKKNAPSWWDSYNKVKHHRNDMFELANLENVLHSVGGLLVLLFYYYKLTYNQKQPSISDKQIMTIELDPETEFLRLDDKFYYLRAVL